MNTSNLPSRPLRFRLIAYLIILLLTQGVVAYGALLVFDSLPPELTGASVSHDQAYRDAMRGSIELVREKLKDKRQNYEKTLDELRPLFSYPLILAPFDLPLSEDVQEQLLVDDIAVDEDRFVFYAKLPSSDLLQIGPVLDPEIFEPDPMATILLLLLWSLLSAIIFFGLLYLALTPLWRDAFVIRDTAEDLAQGKLKSRANTVHSWLFKPLAGVLNDMAVKIEKQVHNSRIMSHAIAHELRTPLARLRFALGMMDETISNPEKYRKYKEEIYSDIEELETLINVSLDYFRMEQHKIVLHRTDISLKKWGEEICAGLMPLKPLHFELVLNVEDKPSYFDSQIATIAVNNLLLNAFKYAVSRVELGISQQSDGSILVEVDDDGPGIPEELYEEVFVPFSRLDNSRTKTTGGVGLGLSYVKLIVEQHHGNIQIRKSLLGGTKFIIRLDAEDDPDQDNY